MSADTKTDTHDDSTDRVDPYRLMFPLGAATGILAALLWTMFQARWINFYPRTAHANLMFFGYLWCFIAGFMMTAVPKMTGTRPAGYAEIFLAFTLGFMQIALNIRNQDTLPVLLFGVQNIFLMVFVLRRFVKVGRIPFPGFIFVPVAFAMSLAGVAASLKGGAAPGLVPLLCGEAFVLNLIVGLGSRLIPVISRLPGSLTPADQDLPGTGHTLLDKARPWIMPLTVAVIINTGFIVQASGAATAGITLRLAGTIAGATVFLRLFSAPVRWTCVGAGLKAGVLFMLLGQVLSLPVLNLGLAASHVGYIGSFSLITLLISTRVVLAHGNQPLSYEVSSKRILFIGVFTALAALLRLGSAFGYTTVMIQCAVVVFVLAIALWSGKFLKVLRPAAGPGQPQ